MSWTEAPNLSPYSKSVVSSGSKQNSKRVACKKRMKSSLSCKICAFPSNMGLVLSTNFHRDLKTCLLISICVIILHKEHFLFATTIRFSNSTLGWVNRKLPNPHNITFSFKKHLLVQWWFLHQNYLTYRQGCHIAVPGKVKLGKDVCAQCLKPISCSGKLHTSNSHFATRVAIGLYTATMILLVPSTIIKIMTKYGDNDRALWMVNGSSLGPKSYHYLTTVSESAFLGENLVNCLRSSIFSTRWVFIRLTAPMLSLRNLKLLHVCCTADKALLNFTNLTYLIG